MGNSSRSGYFSGLSVACLIAAICFFFVSLVVWQFAWHEKGVLVFGFVMFLGGVGNSLAFRILARMESVGYEIGFWRWPGTDFELYRQYWQIAPSKGWSRWVLVGAVVCMVSVLGLFLAIWL